MTGRLAPPTERPAAQVVSATARRCPACDTGSDEPVCFACGAPTVPGSVVGRGVRAVKEARRT